MQNQNHSRMVVPALLLACVVLWGRSACAAARRATGNKTPSSRICMVVRPVAFHPDFPEAGGDYTKTALEKQDYHFVSRVNGELTDTPEAKVSSLLEAAGVLLRLMADISLMWIGIPETWPFMKSQPERNTG